MQTASLGLHAAPWRRLCLRLVAPLALVASLGLGSCSESLTDADGQTLLACLQERDDIRLLGPVLHDAPRVLDDERVLFVDSDTRRSGIATTALAVMNPTTIVTRRYAIDAEPDPIGFARVWGFEPCPYDPDRILTLRYAGTEAWRLDHGAVRVAADAPQGWSSPMIEGFTATSWLASSQPGRDSIAGFLHATNEPVVFAPQTGAFLDDSEGPVPISDAPGGRHRLALERSSGGDQLFIDGVALPPLPLARSYRARWSPSGSRLLLEVLPSSGGELEYVIAEIPSGGAALSVRAFTTTPACLPILELDFLSEDSLIASAVEDESNAVLLYELTLDGRAIRQMTDN